MSSFDPDVENATESGDSGSSTDDEPVKYQPRLGGRRIREVDAGAPRRDLSPPRVRPRVPVAQVSTALVLQLRASDVLFCGNRACSRRVYPGYDSEGKPYLFCGISCGRLVRPRVLG